jgi:hypothetical protein
MELSEMSMSLGAIKQLMSIELSDISILTAANDSLSLQLLTSFPATCDPIFKSNLQTQHSITAFHADVCPTNEITESLPSNLLGDPSIMPSKLSTKYPT